jgi:hypothetical protein
VLDSEDSGCGVFCILLGFDLVKLFDYNGINMNLIVEVFFSENEDICIADGLYWSLFTIDWSFNTKNSLTFNFLKS